jgi:hypothetical protein
MNQDELYDKGRAEAIKKLISLQNQNNINQDRRRNAVTTVRDVLRDRRSSNQEVVAEPRLVEEEGVANDVVVENPDVNSEAIVAVVVPDDVAAVVSEEVKEAIVEENPDQAVEIPVQVEEEKYNDFVPIISVPIASTFHDNYAIPLHRILKTKPKPPIDDDEPLSFAARRMRFSGNPRTAAPSVSTGAAAGGAAAPCPIDTRTNLRHRRQIAKLKADCLKYCAELGKKLEDEIPTDAPKEEWENLYHDLLTEKKKKKAKGLYRDALDWSSLFVQQVVESFHPVGLQGRGFSKVIRESKDFDNDLDELYEEQDISWFRNIPPAATIVNKYINKFSENHWENLTGDKEKNDAATQEEKGPVLHEKSVAPPVAPQPPVARPLPARPKKKNVRKAEPVAAVAMQQQPQWDPAIMQQFMYYQMMMQQQQYALAQQQQQQQFQVPMTQLSHGAPMTQFLPPLTAPMTQFVPPVTAPQQPLIAPIVQPPITTAPVIIAPEGDTKLDVSEALAKTDRKAFFERRKKEMNL